MKKTSLKKLLVIALSVLMVVTVFAGCAARKAVRDIRKDNGIYGTLLLSVNPEIFIEYDENGNVVSLKGGNAEGTAIIADSESYKGRSCNEVVKELVAMIYDQGYFLEEVEGNTKNIVIKLEEGSKYPDDSFLEGIENDIRIEIGNLGLTSSPVTVDESDYDEYGRISVDKAKEIALTQAGLSEETVVFTERDYDNDDNVYEMEFVSNGVKYEFEVNAINGKVTEADYELNDDWYKNDNADHYYETTVPDTAPAEDIGKDAAIEIALEYAGLSVADYVRCEYDRSDNDYDIEFKAGGVEYDVEVDAKSGAVTGFDKDYDDDIRFESSPSSDTSSSETTLTVYYDDDWDDDDRYDDDRDDDDRYDDDDWDDDDWYDD